MRWIGIDIGERRIGVATSDPMGTFAQPLTTVEVRGDPEDGIERIAELARQRGAEGIVVGLPRRMSGERGPEAEAAEAFARSLRQAVGIPVVLWDERLSSVEAGRLLEDAGVRRRRRRQVVDRVAAALILQGFLDRRGREGPDGGDAGEAQEGMAGEDGAGEGGVDDRAPPQEGETS